jgi:hypothetical protein
MPILLLLGEAPLEENSLFILGGCGICRLSEVRSMFTNGMPKRGEERGRGRAKRAVLIRFLPVQTLPQTVRWNHI